MPELNGSLHRTYFHAVAAIPALAGKLNQRHLFLLFRAGYEFIDLADLHAQHAADARLLPHYNGFGIRHPGVAHESDITG